MPKPKVVKTPQPVKVPTSVANRALTTMELATSWIDEAGMISPEEGLKRVFDAAREGGTFTVCTKGDRPGETSTLRYRSYPEALAVYIHFFNQQRRPLMYAATYNRDTQLLPRRGYQAADKSFVSSADATADEAQALLDAWCRGVGIKNQPTAPMIETMRPPKYRKRKRERL